MIKVTTAEVHLTDTTLRQLQAAVEQRMKEPLVTTPMPDGDMSDKQYLAAQYERGIIRVRSPYAETFVIDLNPNTESIGYHLVQP